MYSMLGLMCDCISLPLVQYIACQKCDFWKQPTLFNVLHHCEGSHPSACLNLCCLKHSGGLRYKHTSDVSSVSPQIFCYSPTVVNDQCIHHAVGTDALPGDNFNVMKHLQVLISWVSLYFILFFFLLVVVVMVVSDLAQRSYIRAEQMGLPIK